MFIDFILPNYRRSLFVSIQLKYDPTQPHSAQPPIHSDALHNLPLSLSVPLCHAKVC